MLILNQMGGRVQNLKLKTKPVPNSFCYVSKDLPPVSHTDTNSVDVSYQKFGRIGKDKIIKTSQLKCMRGLPRLKISKNVILERFPNKRGFLLNLVILLRNYF